MDGAELLQLATAVTPHVAYFLPRNASPEQLASLAPCLAPHGPYSRHRVEPCEVESHVVNQKLKTRTAYYGGLLVEPPR
jgi:trimethylguanosine synthase